ncbi:Uncharacterised protein [Mycobacteroides abscessus subsp. bolletii]|nr:Uncharacterised protein [Mycobacteroides abscessus subsp. bolletii]SLF65745.1 Uncharacterised protein [Mycobacteroides abscessus subsp. bolletii]
MSSPGEPVTDSEFFDKHTIAMRGTQIQRAVLYTGVFTVERTVTDKGQLPNDVVSIVPERSSFATPFAIYDAESELAADSFGWMLGAHRVPEDFSEATVDLPLHRKVSTNSSFSLTGKKLSIAIHSTPRRTALRELSLPARVVYFLRLTQTLGVQIRYNERTRYFGTIVREGVDIRRPLIAMHRGTLNPGIREKSKNWEAFNSYYESVFVGGDDSGDDRTYVGYASRVREQFPLNVTRSTCLRCKSTTRLTVEHCTPKWLTDRLNVTPVTAKILCKPCNAAFGAELEEPVAALYDSGMLDDPAHRALVTRWAVKTAIMLSSVSNVQIPQELFDFVEGHNADSSVAVYCTGGARSFLDSGYLYVVTKFRPELATNSFLFSMNFGPILFVVARTTSELGQLPLIDKWAPSYAPGLAAVGDIKIHDWIMRNKFGIDLEYGPYQDRSAQRR